MSKCQFLRTALLYHCCLVWNNLLASTQRRSGRSLSSERKRDLKVSSSCLGRNSSGNSSVLPLPPASFAPAGFEPMRRAASPLLVMRLLQSHPHSVAAWDQPLPRKQWILCPYGAYSRVRITVESLLRVPLTRLPASEIHLMAGVNAERNGGNER